MNEKLVVQFYRLLIRFYPADHRRGFEKEMVGVFEQSLAEAQRQGHGAVIGLLFRELWHLPAGLAQAYTQSWQQWRPAMVSAPDWPWMAGWAVGTTLALPLAWLLMVPLAGILLLLLRLAGASVIANPNILRASGFLLAIALLVATLQWFLLRRHLAGAGWWFGATFAGWLAGGVALVAAGLLLPRLGLAAELLMPKIFAPIVGLAVGLPQMLVLRRLTTHAVWWIPLNLLAFSSLLIAGRAFESISELIIVLSLPGAVSALGLWWLLREAPHDAGRPVAASSSRKRPWFRRPASVALVAIALVALCALGPWVFAVTQLELAKSEGIYATPEEAIIARHSEGWGGARVVSIEGVRAGPNRRDGGMDHVWFGGARVTYDRVPVGGRRDNYLTGSFYVRVRDGWVHIPEGAFPELVGWLMEVYDLEGQ